MANFQGSTMTNIIALVLGIIGLIWLLKSLWENWKISRIKSWPIAEATVVTANAEPRNTNILLEPQTIIPSADGNARYLPRVSYRYVVNGLEYHSNNVIYNSARSYNAADTRALLMNINPGSTVRVRYNPSNPREAYIYAGTHDWTGVFVGIILLLIAGILGYHHNVKDIRTITTDFGFDTTNFTNIPDFFRRTTTVAKTPFNRHGFH